MKKSKLIFVFALSLALLFASTAVSFAAEPIVLSDDVSIVPYDWRDTWDANQNNAYIDILKGMNIPLRRSRLSGVARATVPDKRSHIKCYLAWLGSRP